MKKIMILILNLMLVSMINGEKYEIAVIPKGSSQMFWKYVEEGAVKAGKELGVDVTFRGPRYENNTESQIKLMEMYIRKGVDAIVLAPNQKKALSYVVKEAVDNKIKVIVIDSELAGDYYESFIATDNFDAGKKAGEKLAEMIDYKGKVGLIRFKKGNASTDMREEGFMEAMEELGIEVAVDEYGGATLGKSNRRSIEILNKNPDLKGIFTPNESLTEGMAKAINSLGLNEKITLMGFDFNQGIEKGIVNGSIDSVVVQQPILMGYLGVKTAFEVLQGKEVDKRVVVDISFFPENQE